MRAGQRGFSYLLLLFAVAALGIAAAGSALMWSTLSQTERERELLFIGGEFSRALQRYYDASPAEPKAYPARLEDLIEDKRHQVPMRHLRKIYVDPMTNNRDWGLVVSQGQIRAIHSRSEKVARIHVLPRWVDATGDKVATSLKTPLTQPSAAVPGQPPAVPGPLSPTARSAARPTGDLRHADWLFVPVADTPAQQNTPGSSPSVSGSAAGSTPVVVGESGDGSSAPQAGGAGGSLQEQYTGKR
ncbi:hypothetical protein [Methyloversatilis discipulorum]|uniref:hypothetical protein n=1 Tax=Methyloversatilis discipulorum TaxID=1119528 RepID=UPI001A5308A2|nr:hypothetical protein [Methyloversatilis discipulorum]MBL8469018.1 general secretion pathway protein [Methyloversatilis discipulorum]